MRYSVFQYHMSREIMDKVNELGWTDAKAQYPEVAIQLDVKFMFGSENYEDWMAEHYTHVLNIDAATLPQVFHVGNVGPDSAMERVAERAHSVSIGDIIRDNETNVCYMVDPDGFTALGQIREAA